MRYTHYIFLFKGKCEYFFLPFSFSPQILANSTHQLTSGLTHHLVESEVDPALSTLRSTGNRPGCTADWQIHHRLLLHAVDLAVPAVDHGPRVHLSPACDCGEETQEPRGARDDEDTVVVLVRSPVETGGLLPRHGTRPVHSLLVRPRRAT